MVNFHTFKGRWGIPNICYIIFKQRQNAFCIQTFSKMVIVSGEVTEWREIWIMMACQIHDSFYHGFSFSGFSRSISLSTNGLWLDSASSRWMRTSSNHAADFAKPGTCISCQLGGFDDVEGWRLSSSYLHKIQSVFKFWRSEKDLISQCFSKLCHRLWLRLVMVVTLNTWKSHRPKAWY